MKKMFVLLMAVILVTVSVTACGESGKEKETTTKTPETTTAAEETTTAAPETTTPEETATEAAEETTTEAAEEVTTEAAEETTPEETTTEFVPITEGTIDLTAATVELADGWYVSKEPTDTEVTLKNDSIKSSMAYVKVKCSTVFSGEGAQHWVEATQRNVEGKGEISNVTYNGVDYYMLANYTDTGKQSSLFADSSDGKYWVQVTIMFMGFEEAESVFGCISVK